MTKTTRRGLAAAATAFGLLFAATTTQAADIEKIHFIIPGGAGGGWDGTARGTGEALTKAGLIGQASYENMSGGGGGLAIAHLIEIAGKADDTIMVNSTPIVIRSLQKVFPQSFRDLTPIAGTVGDYAAIIVAKDSDIADFGSLVSAVKADPTKMPIGGGSVAGGMDHVVAAMVMKGAGASPTSVKYVPYDAGGKAMAGLLSGEIKALSTGFGEAIELAKQDQVRILCVTAAGRVDAAKDVPTCDEAGSTGVEFINWRGFFGAPGLSADKQQAYIAAFASMYQTPEWEEVRARNGWVNIFNPGEDFSAFLEKQEKEIADLMKELGFL